MGLIMKNHESQLKKIKKNESETENAWAFMFNQRVNLKTDSKTLYYSTLKLKYGASIFKEQQRLKEICIVQQQP